MSQLLDKTNRSTKPVLEAGASEWNDHNAIPDTKTDKVSKNFEETETSDKMNHPHIANKYIVGESV